jgi:hypothetical protein
MVDVAGIRRADVPRHTAFTPAEVVDRRHVREEVEPLGVAQVTRRFDEARGRDDDRRLAVTRDDLDQPRDAAEVAQDATLRIS